MAMKRDFIAVCLSRAVIPRGFWGGAKNGDNNLTWIYAISGVALSTGNKKISGHSAAADDIIILTKK